MLNDLIRRTNALAYELKDLRASGAEDKPRSVKADYDAALAETLRFVTENNVPRDTVVIIENRIVGELRRRDDERKIRSDYAEASMRLERARKEVDWLRRGVEAGMGAAQLRYDQARIKMEDFRKSTERASDIERSAFADAFGDLDKEYLAAKREYERVGTSDRDELVKELRKAESELAEAQDDYAESERLMGMLPLSKPLTEVVSGSGAVGRALDEAARKAAEAEQKSKKAAQEEIYTAVPIDGSVGELPEELPVTGIPVSGSAEPDEQTRAQISEAVGRMLKNNERFKYILEEVRFQASVEVAKIRDEVDRIRREAFAEAQQLMDELYRLKEDAAYLRREAARARAAVNAVNKARVTATMNAKRTVNAARKTISAARKAIVAARSVSERPPHDDYDI